MDALVIMHLSSLDSYTWHVGEKRGLALARRLRDAVLAHRGPVFVIDQGWPLGTEPSAPRAWLLGELHGMIGIDWVKFEEAEDDWGRFLPSFLKRLREHRAIRTITVGGIWFNPNLKTGCATALYNYLRKHLGLAVRVDKRLVGCEL